MRNTPLEIREYPDGILRQSALPVAEIGDDERALFDDMLLCMRCREGIGLAAPQVGIGRRAIVTDIGNGAIRLANPEIVKTRGSDKMEEGCLSVPGVSVDVERPLEVVVRGLDERGNEREIRASGLLARVLQHEIDHLNGKLIVDYQGFLSRFKIRLKRR